MPGHTASSPAADRQTVIVLMTAAMALTVQEYCFNFSNLAWCVEQLSALGRSDLATSWSDWIRRAENAEIARLSWWAVGRLLTYVLLPMVVVKLLLRQPLGDLGLHVRGIGRSLPLYLLLLALILPAVWYFSRTPHFQQTYPFYELLPGEALWPRFWIWELLYALQFVSLEFFFRGFMVHGTKHALGRASIYVMMLPYVMLHFTKPMPETLGAIGAGVILGHLSFKTCSIWWGAGLHIAVAWTMDLLALWHRGLI